MSNRYRITAGTPEGFDWVLDLEHDTTFDQESFKVIVEEAFCRTIDEQIKKDGYAHKSSLDTDVLTRILGEAGFRSADRPVARYDFEPYWGESHIGATLLAKLNEAEKISDEYFEKMHKADGGDRT